MRYALIAAAAVLGLTAATPPANAVGCLSGGAAGALAGHMAGHGVLGAIGGCIAGHQWHKHQVSQKALQNQQDYVKVGSSKIRIIVIPGRIDLNDTIPRMSSPSSISSEPSPHGLRTA